MGRRRANGPSVSFFAFQDIITSVVGIFVLITLIMMIELVSKSSEGKSGGEQVADTLTGVISSMEAEVERLRTRVASLAERTTAVGGIQRFNVDEIRGDIENQIKQVGKQAEQAEAVNKQIRKVLLQVEGQANQLNERAVATEPKRDELKELLEKLEFLDSKLNELSTDDPLIFRNADLMGKSIVVVDIQTTSIGILDLSRDLRLGFSGSDRLGKFKSWLRQQKGGAIHFFLLVRPGAASSFVAIETELENSKWSFGFDVIPENRSLKLRSEAIN